MVRLRAVRAQGPTSAQVPTITSLGAVSSSTWLSVSLGAALLLATIASATILGHDESVTGSQLVNSPTSSGRAAGKTRFSVGCPDCSGKRKIGSSEILSDGQMMR